ncbi:unnamed protein product [Orchesella dallaii]|uniref:Uncharacterized protein n=1 Tax=Orchesella dallaii TaxID=48710 RepID=A0ABP1RKE3_9HEXA
MVDGLYRLVVHWHNRVVCLQVGRSGSLRDILGSGFGAWCRCRLLPVVTRFFAFIADRDPSVEGPTLTLLSLFGTTPFGTPNLHSELELCPGVPPIGSLHGTGSEGTTPYPFTAVPSNAPIGVTPGSDSNREWRLGVTNGVVPNNDSKVRVGPSTDGSRKAIKAKKRFITGSNHHRHEAPNPVPIMSLKFPYPPTRRLTTLSCHRQQGDKDQPFKIHKLASPNSEQI